MFASIEFVYYAWIFIIAAILFLMLPFVALHVIVTIPFYLYWGSLETKGIVSKDYFNNLSPTQHLTLPYRFIFAKIFHKPFHY